MDDPAPRPAPASAPGPAPTPGPGPGAGVVLAAPDSFKGTASADQVARAIVAGATLAGRPSQACPLSDGGEGFADVLAVLGGEVRTATVTGPAGSPVVARWRLCGDLAVVESAQASGLVLAGGAAGNDPVAATSRGTGELIAAARAAGARRILVGVGGSATTDGGWGAVEALEEAGGLAGVEVEVACDTRTRFGEAARVFGPQKGADPAQVELLSARLRERAALYAARYGVDVAALAGSGAAGGLAGGLAALGARLRSGFEVVSGALDLERRARAAALVVTGEGRVDDTSWTGKVVGGVADLAGRLGLPVLVVAGSVSGAPPSEGPPLTMVSLSERFGEARALAAPAACVAEVVAAELVPPAGG